MRVRLEDLLSSFRRHLRAASKAPRTIELYSQSVRYFSRWLTDRGRESVLDELIRHAIAAWLAELGDTCEHLHHRGAGRPQTWACRSLGTHGFPRATQATISVRRVKPSLMRMLRT